MRDVETAPSNNAARPRVPKCLEKTPTMPRWIRRQVLKGEDARALAVANHLNDDSTSPWYGKIRMANDESDGATINQKSFVTSLRRHVFSANNPLSNPVWDVNRPMILLNYWKAVSELLVDGSETSTVIFKTNGVELFHTVSPTVFTHLATKEDFTKDTIKALLRHGFGNLPPEHIGMSHPEWWHRGGAASGLNRGAIGKLASALSHAINVRDNAGGVKL
jgi:hypothetical protein